MLATLRSKTGGILAKAFIGLLALSFAVWGINDIFTGYRFDALVTVGETEISRQQYENAFQNRLRQMAVTLRRQLTIDEAKTLGVDRQVLGDLIRQASLDGQAIDLELAVSDKEVARQIANNPAFKDASGRFNAQTFRQLLAHNGISEAGFVIQERQRILRTELAGAVDQELSVPNTLTKAAWSFNNETRTARYFVLPESEADAPPEPSESDLKTYYDSNKRTFTAPEQRTLSLLRLQPADVAETVSVTEEELKAAYDRRIGTFSVPERRTVQQIAFLNKEEAEAARKRILEGTDFLEIAKEKGLTEKDYNLGSVTQSEIADPAIGLAAFKLDKDKVSDVVSGSLATVLLRATDIVFGSVQPFAEARAQLEKDLKLERGKEELLNLHDRIEDDRAAGSVLAEIAKSINLPAITVDSIDRQGNDANGTKVEGIPATAAVLQLAFESDVGVENDPVETPEEGFVWVDVLAVTPEALKPYDEVKEKAKELWIESKKSNSLRATARKLVEEANTGTDFADIAKRYNQQIASTEAMTRNSHSGSLGRVALQAIFNTPNGRSAMSQPLDGKGMLIFQTTDVSSPDFSGSSGGAKQVATALRSGISQDLLQQYLVDVQANIGVNINERLWAEIQDPTSVYQQQHY
ncbi:MAG: SurA N-terminal domain-containing protein [Pseudomonadota bacterium]